MPNPLRYMSAATVANADKPGCLKDYALFRFEADAVEMAQALSLEDWRWWWPKVRPPFERMWVEWSRGPLAEGFGMCVLEIVACRVHLHVYEPMEKQLLARNLFVYDLVSRSDTRYVDTGRLDHSSWTTPYLDRYGPPPVQTLQAYDIMLPGRLAPHADDVLRAMYREFAGAPRLGFALLALLNTERETLLVEPQYRQGRTLLRNQSVPNIVPTLVVVRPDAVRRVYVTESEESETSRGRRHHQVRSHFRTLRDGRRVPVRSHERGDPALGRTQATYIVERTPASI